MVNNCYSSWYIFLNKTYDIYETLPNYLTLRLTMEVPLGNKLKLKFGITIKKLIINIYYDSVIDNYVIL